MFTYIILLIFAFHVTYSLDAIDKAKAKRHAETQITENFSEDTYTNYN